MRKRNVEAIKILDQYIKHCKKKSNASDKPSDMIAYCNMINVLIYLKHDLEEGKFSL